MKRLFILVLILAVLVIGCGTVENAVAPSTEVVNTDTVSLSDVRAPAFEEDFCTLSFDNTYLGVQWGAGSGCIMWRESGYPGFDYPIIISTTQAIHADEVKLTVGWGKYVYKKTGDGYAYKESGNLLDKETGTTVLQWGHAKEVLVLWDESSSYYSVYDFQEGTEIVE